MKLREILNGVAALPREAVSLIERRAELVETGKGVTIVEAGEAWRYLYFVGEGIGRGYSLVDGREVTFWIGAEGSVALSMQSYINSLPGYESIVTLEPCRLYRIAVKDMQELYSTDIDIANWGRKFAENEILRAERSLIPMLHTTGRERYERLLSEHPELLRRIPLGDLATYLGLTPVSLSRIRSRLADKGK